MTHRTIAALFDLDGVILNTEPEYSQFWGLQGKTYHPEVEHLELKIKGQTLKEIYDRFFKDETELQVKITEDLNKFEEKMSYNYVPGLFPFLDELKRHNVKTAVVTSSNDKKMQSLYKVHPEFTNLFDIILTADDISQSKPNPEGYLLAAKKLNVPTDDCIVFEDSFNGIEAGKRAGMKVVALATTNTVASLEGKADEVVDDFTKFSYHQFLTLF